jgi:hypothetical protein
MEFSSADFMKFTIQEAADILADKLQENKKDENKRNRSRMKLYGKVDDQLCEIEITMREVVE